MALFKNILAVIAGYAIFVASSLALFQLSGQKPHEEAPVHFMLFALIYGAAFSVLSGWITQLISSAGMLTVNMILAGIIAGFALFSLVKSEGSHWTQMMAIVVFAPASVLGGWWLVKKKR